MLIDSIKSCRFIHRILITVCAAGLFFGLKSSKDWELDNAIREIEIIINSNIRQSIQRYFSNDDETRKYRDTMNNIISELKLRHSEPDFEPFPVYIENDSVGFFKESVTIEELHSYFNSRREVQIKIPIIKSSQNDEIKKVLKSFLTPERNYIYDKGLNQFYFTTVRIGYDEDKNRGVLQLRSGGTTISENLVNETKFTFVPIRFHVIDILESESSLSKLVRIQDNNKILFPFLKRYWNEIRDLTLIEARQLLAGRKASTEETLALFGLSIPSKIAIWIIPGTILFLIIYLRSHLINLLSLMKSSDSNIEEIYGFPWLALFKDRLSQLLMFITIIVFPVVTNICIVLKSVKNTSISYIVLSILLSLSSLALGIGLVFNFKEIKDLYVNVEKPINKHE